VSIKTYLRAKATVLQPLRTEVVKRQTDLLVELLDFISNGKNEFFNKMDYLGIVYCNVILNMEEYGYVLKENSVFEKAKETTSGFYIIAESKQLNFLPKTFSIKEELNKQHEEETKKGKEKLLRARKGEIELERIFYTNQYLDTITELKMFTENPFLPANIQTEIRKIDSDISYNLTTILPCEIKEFIFKLSKTNGSVENPLNISPIGVYNKFQRKCNHHDEAIKHIIFLTREYLMVDKKWDS
jgi:hypothetical protein